MKSFGILFLCTISLLAREAVLFDDIASLQKWYAQQLQVKEIELNTVVSDMNNTVSKEEQNDITEYVESIEEVNETNISTAKVSAIKNIVENEKVTEKNREVNLPRTIVKDVNITDLTGQIEQNTTKPIVIVNYIGNSSSQQLCKSLSKEYIDFWNLLDLTLINATAIILKKHDIKISEENLEIIRSEYYPNLSIGYGGEYYHGFSQTSQAGVGGTYYPATSTYRDALSLKINHELYRFGATDIKVKIGEKEIALVKSQLELQAEDISKQLLDQYATVLRTQKFIEYKTKIKELQERIIQKKERLYKAGQLAKIVIAKDQLTLINIEKEIAQQKIAMMRAINNIEKLANITIDITRSKFAMLEPKNSKVKTFEESAYARHLRLQIDKKLEELELVRKDYLPAVYASGNYVMLGSDKALFDAIKDIKRNSWDVGLSINWDLFNGYKTDKTVDRIKYELRKLTDQYHLAKIDFEMKQKERNMLKKSIAKLLKVESEIYEQTCQQESILSKLRDVGLVDAIQLDSIQMNKIQSELDFTLGVIDKVYQTISSELIR